jgi:hypothetical protein
VLSKAFEGAKYLQTVLIVLVITCLLLGVIVGEVRSDMPANYVSISCLNQNNSSVDSLSLSFIAFDNNSLILSGSSLFQAVGYASALTINVESSGPSPISISANFLSSTAFYYATNGVNRNWFIGSYYEQYGVNATTENNGVSYYLNFSNDIERAKSAINYNGSVENVGITGTFSFDVKISDPVGSIGQTRFSNVILNGNGNLTSVNYDFTIPQDAQLKEAENGNQAIPNIGAPYRVGTSISVIPSQSLGTNLYVEWEMPEETPLFVIVLYNPYFLLFFGIFLGAFLQYIGRRFYNRRRKQS